MTDSYNTLTVVFEGPIREDDIQSWIDAIMMLRKVIKVVPGEKDSAFGAAEQARHEIRMKLYEVARGFSGL